MPYLSFRKRFAEAGHTGQANAIEDLPIGLTRLIVGDTFSLEQLRWARVHSRGNRRLRREGYTMANRAMLLVKLGASRVARFVRLDRDGLGMSFAMRAFKALCARKFSNGISESVVATGALPPVKYR